MAATQRYRAQHTELLALSNQILSLIGAGDIVGRAASVRTLLSVLAGKLSIHLAMEDKTLYPNLMLHHDPDIRALATRYSDEMGSLAEDFTQFNRRWLTAAHMEKSPAEFVAEATKIFAALTSRIEKEDQGLYRLVDAIE
jgi:Hemerythrin HHE cation binding domain